MHRDYLILYHSFIKQILDYNSTHKNHICIKLVSTKKINGYIYFEMIYNKENIFVAINTLPFHIYDYTIFAVAERNEMLFSNDYNFKDCFNLPENIASSVDRLTKK